MPYVNIQITKGASREQKRIIVQQITFCLVEVLGKRPDQTHIVITEIEEENWGFNGQLTDDYRKSTSQGDYRCHY